MKNLIYFFISISLIGCTVSEDQSAIILQPLVSKVVAIQDGDTIELRFVYTGDKAKERQGKNIRIRFDHIDTPERGKAFYKVAKDFVADACFEKEVTILHEGEFGRYGRLIGEVILPNGENLNKMLVSAGLARHYKKYSDDTSYAQLENEAREKKLKIWGLKDIHEAFENFDRD